jgi:heterodisulfide reductase subunit B
MTEEYLFEASYFPGCTMKTGVDESNLPMEIVLRKLKVKLNEIDDWNCCGSSSGHALNHEIPVGMGARNLSRAPRGLPVVIPCPNCYRNWVSAHYHLSNEPALVHKYEDQFGRLNLDVEILNIYDLYHQVLSDAKAKGITFEGATPLKGLKVAVYYGCGAMYPKFLRPDDKPKFTVEKVIGLIGAQNVIWPWPNRCCSAFVSAVYPDIAEELVTQIVTGAYDSGAEAIVTTCAMCQMNLEMRTVSAKLGHKLPIFHLNQLMALYLGEKAKDHKDWWKYHLVDPIPALTKAGLWDIPEPEEVKEAKAS